MGLIIIQGYMSTFYLNIIGFSIKVSMIKPRFTVFLRDKLQREIMMLFRDFVSLEKTKEVDFTIEFRESNIMGVIPGVQSKFHFINLYEQKSQKMIRTYYSISTSQFHYIITEILSTLIKDTGFFQHASSIIHNGKAYLFLGKSGAGKTTISTLLRKRFFRFADDLVLIRKIGGIYRCFQNPLWERNWWLSKHTESYVLGKVFFLRKSERCNISRVKNSKQILRLLLGDFTYDGVQVKDKMEIFMKFVSEFSHFYYLDFPKDEKKVVGFFEKPGVLD